MIFPCLPSRRECRLATTRSIKHADDDGASNILRGKISQISQSEYETRIRTSTIWRVLPKGLTRPPPLRRVCCLRENQEGRKAPCGSARQTSSPSPPKLNVQIAPTRIRNGSRAGSYATLKRSTTYRLRRVVRVRVRRPPAFEVGRRVRIAVELATDRRRGREELLQPSLDHVLASTRLGLPVVWQSSGRGGEESEKRTKHPDHAIIMVYRFPVVSRINDGGGGDDGRRAKSAHCFSHYAASIYGN